VLAFRALFLSDHAVARQALWLVLVVCQLVRPDNVLECALG